MPAEAKPCPRCLQTKPASDFHRNVTTEDGRAWQCKGCMSAYMKRYRSRPSVREKARTYMRSYQRRDYVKSRAKQYYARTDVSRRVRAYQHKYHSSANLHSPHPAN